MIRNKLSSLISSVLKHPMIMGGAWAVTGNILGRGLTLASSIFVARILGKQGYGELGIIQSTIGTFGILAGFRMGLTATKHVAEFKRTDPARAMRIIGLSGRVAWSSGLLMMGILILIAPGLSSGALAAPQLAGLLRAASPLLLLSAINSAQVGALAGFEAFRRIAKITVLQGILSFAFVLAGAYFLGVAGALWGMNLGQAFGCLLNYMALRKESRSLGAKLDYRGGLKELEVLRDFSIPALLSSLVVGVVNWACAVLLVNRGGGYGQMAEWNVANQWFMAIVFIPSILGQVVLPIFSDAHRAPESGRSPHLLRFAHNVNLLVGGIPVLGFSILSPIIVSLYGGAYKSAWPTLVASLVAAGLLAAQNPALQFITSRGRMWASFWIFVFWGATYLLASIAFLSDGALGLSLSRMIAYSAQLLLVLAFSKRLLQTEQAAAARTQAPKSPGGLAA